MGIANVSRRGFFASIAAAVIGGSQIDPESLLWVPGKKLISIPSPTFSDEHIAETIAAQIEAMRPYIKNLFLESDKAWERIALRDGPTDFRIPLRDGPADFRIPYAFTAGGPMR